MQTGFDAVAACDQRQVVDRVGVAEQAAGDRDVARIRDDRDVAVRAERAGQEQRRSGFESDVVVDRQ